jgi:hypothetical protein
MDDTGSTLVFTQKVVIAGMMLTIGAVLLGIHLASVGSPDVALYYELLESSQASSRREQLELSGRQERQGVRKMVVMSKKTGRHMLRLFCEKSTLRFSLNSKGGDLVEEMDNVLCDQQEGLFYQFPGGKVLEKQANGRLLAVGGDEADQASWFDIDTPGLQPMQRVRHVDAEKATYYYKRDLLSAETVNLTRFTEVSHRMPDAWEVISPMMHGMAESVKFSMVGSDPSFKAYHLKLTLYSKEGLL